MGISDKAAWDAIVDSGVLAGVYSRELYWLANDVVERLDSVFERTPAPGPAPGDGYIQVDPRLHAEINAALGSAAKVRALISERPKTRRQSEAAHKLLLDRTRSLLASVQGLELSLIRSAAVRNSLEHFDERIDASWEKILAGDIPLPVSVLVDLAVWDMGSLAAIGIEGAYALRLYVASERLFSNAGSEIDLGKLHEEASGIVDRLAPSIPEEERGGFILPVLPEMFDG